MKARRDELLVRRLGQQIASDLLNCELVETLVAVKGFDDPFAVRPHLPVIVEMQAVRVGVARRIQPVAGAMLPVAWRREQLVHEFFIRTGRGIIHDSLHLLRRGRQPREIQRHPPRQRPPIRFRRRLQARGREPFPHKRIHRMRRRPRR